jgi:multiple sugar transport system substrate-binding protein
MQRKNFSRREFLKQAGLTGVGMALAGCTAIQVQPAVQQQSGADAEPPAEQFELSLWGWWDIRMELYRDVANQFMEDHPNVVITVESIASDRLPKLYSALAAGTGPDMTKMGSLGEMHQMRGENLLLEFPEDKFPISWIKEAYPLFDVETNGRYVLPTGTACTLLIYNKAMFAEAGLDPESPPKTWDDFIAAAKATTKKDANGTITQTGMIVTPEYPVMNQIYQLGGNIIKNDGETQTSTYTSPEVKEAFQYIADLALVHECWDPAFPGNVEAMGTGLAAMTEEQTWVIGEFTGTYPDIYPDIGFAANPTPTGEPEPVYGYKDTVTSISALAGHPENYSATFDFLEFLYKDGGKEAYLALCELIQLVPERTDLMDDPRLLASPGLAKAAEVLSKERNYAAIPERVTEVMTNTLHAIVLEGMAIDEALEIGDAAIQGIIDEGLAKHWV